MNRCGVTIVACVSLLNTMTGQQTADRSQPRVEAFIKAIDRREDFPSRWEQIRSVAAEFGLERNVSIETWKKLLEIAAKGSLKSRFAVQLHPVVRKRPFFDVMMHEFGLDSDLFTRWGVLGRMEQFYPEDPKCPKYGLLLLLESWNAEWPKGINLHGNSPRDAGLLSVATQWDVADETLTPEICGRLLSESEKWKFDRRTSRWRLSDNPAWLPRVGIP